MNGVGYGCCVSVNRGWGTLPTLSRVRVVAGVVGLLWVGGRGLVGCLLGWVSRLLRVDGRCRHVSLQGGLDGHSHTVCKQGKGPFLKAFFKNTNVE